MEEAEVSVAMEEEEWVWAGLVAAIADQAAKEVHERHLMLSV